MGHVNRELVRQRAGRRCEYCRLPDFAVDLPFHVEHIVANVHQVDDSATNLAWACPRCNLRKGPNLTTIDPETATKVDLYNPRKMN
jgi:5-methylcytosine-specific restriction endonuclease McrA